MAEFPVLQTERLILRCVREDDLDAFAAMMADPEAARFLGGVKSRAEVWRSLASLAGSWVLKGYSMFSVVEKESGRWIGRIGPRSPEGWPGTEVAWGLTRSAWGQCYAAEAAAAAIDFAFEQLGWSEVIHTIDPDNARSATLAKRVGSRWLRPGRLPAPIDIDLDVWGQSREDWRARRGGVVRP